MELSPPEPTGATRANPPRTYPPMFAIVSYIHGILEAFSAVLAEIDRRCVQHIMCLGDIVGYGPNPMECMDLLIQRCRASLMGNHDFAVFYEPYNFNAG